MFHLDAANVDEDEFTLEMIEVGAEEVEFDEGNVEVIGRMEEFGELQKAIQKQGLECTEAGLQRVPTTMKSLDEKNFKTFLKLIDILEDDDDVQKVYHNVEFNEQFI